MHKRWHLAGEPLDVHGNADVQPAQTPGQFLVPSANHDELQFQSGAPQAFGDLDHHVRALAAEQYDSGGQLGIEPQLAPAFGAARLDWLIELRTQDHPRCGKDMIAIKPRRARLCNRLRSPANDVLLRLSLDPEVRRPVRHIGDHGDIGRRRIHPLQRLIHRSVEIRHQRHHHVRLGPGPMVRQHSHLRPVIQVDDAVHQP